ncbi:uncharacterized protein GGS22DRAFT_168152 [Annulohypoxylon maeteangense]|uniref:uncharacterized protein n=1 Tax=Annulohypoxylon maeteangense TaxID=1927788 RepID=UPI00200775BF|nr:uncharacterized protein GGS22DRAFT_168152 [Annulohypoxylon maeteangense]KAI0883214.1 hypothetical protein GGS22DRAFT_168152 [Annulohypoxylon maeteangense]
MEHSEDRLSRLERLPVEVRSLILSESDCIATLMTTIRASPGLWRAYSQARRSITIRVLLNQLDAHDVRDEALLMMEIVQLPLMDVKEFKNSYIDDFLKPGQRFNVNLEWSEIITINKLHHTITRFADTYSKTISDTTPNPSVSEMGRIMRAMYHFEIHLACARVHPMFHLAQGPNDEVAIANMDGVLRKFAPWENEQLASIWCFFVVMVINPG